MDNIEEKVLNLATLVFPVRGSKVMLATKMGKIGAGYLNGWGGGVEIGETVLACAVREFEEEAGGTIVKEEDLVQVGIAHFKNNKSDGSVFTCTVHVFMVFKWQGEIVSTPEMANPSWHRIADLENQNLMLADKQWLPQMLIGVKGTVYAEYGPHQKTLIGPVRFEIRNSF